MEPEVLENLADLMEKNMGVCGAALPELLAKLAQQLPVDAEGEQGTTALMSAAQAGNAAAVRTLLRLGADPRRRDALGWSVALALISFTICASTSLRRFLEPKKK